MPGMIDGFADPVWSPDGRLILALHGADQSDPRSANGLTTLGPDGSGLAFVADGLGAEHQPDWSAKDC